MFNPQSPKPDFTAIFNSVHTYWSENHIFEASVEKNPADNQFRFYDGPPFVTGLPHYGHLASSVAKDVIPRFQTMKGKRVDRLRGRDCHGIPVEQKVQTNLGLSSNLDIEKIGIETFINGCYDYTRDVSGERKRYIDQFARWVDFDNSYKTMDNDYMESVRRVFKTLWDKGLIYKGKRVSMYSTKLETPISNFEVAMDDTYEDVNDPAITVAFDLSVNGPEYNNTSILVWTTTPWTIPVNIAAGVHKEIEYSSVKVLPGREMSEGQRVYIVASKRVESVFANKEYEVVDTFLGEKLVGLSYKPPYDYLYGKTNNENDHKIYHADFVSDTDGTGLVHQAPEFGEADFQLAKQEDLTITEAMDSSGHYTSLLRSPLGGALTAEAQEMSEGQEGNPPLPLPQREGLHGVFYRDANPIVIQELHDMGTLFHKTSITHRVAFCPRSGTPLVYKAQDSWFIDINGPQASLGGKSLKQKCIEANEDINRYPAHNKHGRFLKSLESAPDRCISRTRYWGTPMPIYKKVAEVQSSKGIKEENVVTDSGSVRANDMMVIGSREELFQLSKNGSKNLTKIILVRHGRTDYNEKRVVDCYDEARLSELGKQQAEKIFQDYKDEHIDAIYCSPKTRCKETIDVLSQHKAIDIIIDDRITEIGGEKVGLPTDGIPYSEFTSLERNKTIGGTQKTVADCYAEIQSFLSDIQKNHAGQTVVVCTHFDATAMVGMILAGMKSSEDYHADARKYAVWNKETDTCYKVLYINTTRNAELDLHRPFIDDVWFEKDGVRYERISEVLDCWVESASMPYAQVHYPFENKEKFENSFPADYIVEYTGQIRAWFYVMHVLGVALFGAPAFKNVICHGVIAGNDGRKMSKSLGNFPDPKPTFAQYGGDAVRMSILTTPLFNGGDMSFSEDLILEALKQNVLPVWNAFSFFVTYANIDKWEAASNKQQATSANRLDTWILEELARVTQTIDSDLSNYDITHASRQISSFLENLTNWYIRRSRRRFWKSDSDEDKAAAYQTLYTVLTQFAIIAAPFMPIISEYIWKALTGDDVNNSVHLQNFPNPGQASVDTSLQTDMNYAQNIVRMGLAARGKKNIRVRQPLRSLTLGVHLEQYYLDIIAEELNIKNIICDINLNTHVTKICKPDGKIIGQLFGGNTKEIFALAKSGQFEQANDGTVVVGEWMLPVGSYELSYIKTDETEDIEVDNGIVMKIDWTITPELEREGYARDLIRSIQDARKEANYDIADRISLKIEGGSLAEDIINHHGATVQEETLSTISYTLDHADITKSVELGENTITLSLQK